MKGFFIVLPLLLLLLLAGCLEMEELPVELFGGFPADVPARENQNVSNLTADPIIVDSEKKG